MEDTNDIFTTGLNKLSEASYFKSLTESLPHKIIIADAESFRIQYSNHYHKAVTNEQVIGRELLDFVWPQHKALFIESLLSVKNTLKPLTVEIEGASLTNKTGTAWYKTHISPLLNEQNSIYGLLMISEDITEMKEKELEIINKSEKIKAILNNTNDIICSIDLNYNITEFNVVFSNLIKLGYGLELEAGMPVLNFIDPKKHEKLRGIYEKVAKGEILIDVESFDTSVGLVYNETSYHPIYNFNKEIVGISIFSKDITNRKRNEEKIQTALKEKEILLAEIHHRIKNNLAIVSSLLQLQELNIASPEAREALKLSRNRIKSTALVHELLYKNDSFQHIYLHEYLDELFHNLRPDNNKHLKVNGSPVEFNIDRAMPLGLLLNELMLNSFKHSYKMDAEGQISISTEIKNNILTLQYCDCEGCFPDHIDFYNPTTTGLLLIHTFVQQLEGNIELVEKSPPKYIINLPLSE